MSDKKTILWVDGDSSVSESICHYLIGSRIDVVPLSTGEDALDYLLNKHPNLIILEMHLKGMGGFKFLKEKTKMESPKDQIPTIIYSSQTWEWHAIQHESVSEFMQKPGNVEILLEIIQKKLHNAEGLNYDGNLKAVD